MKWVLAFAALIGLAVALSRFAGAIGHTIEFVFTRGLQ